MLLSVSTIKGCLSSNGANSPLTVNSDIHTIYTSTRSWTLVRASGPVTGLSGRPPLLPTEHTYPDEIPPRAIPCLPVWRCHVTDANVLLPLPLPSCPELRVCVSQPSRYVSLVSSWPSRAPCLCLFQPSRYVSPDPLADQSKAACL